MTTRILFDFKQFFTPDASDLISNYLNTLQNFMSKQGIDNDQIDIVINGILEFINEYVLNFKNNKISFSSTLSLIEEIGSPTEIIQSLDNKKLIETSTSIKCPYCNLLNSTESRYCEFCGKNLFKKPETTSIDDDKEYYPYKPFKTNFNQDLIDHPYSKGFLIFISSFTIILMILNLTMNIWQINRNVSIIVFIMASFFVSFIVSIVLAVILSIIFGVLIDFFYKDFKSVKFQYDKILSNFEENITGGFLMVFIGISILIFFLALAQTKNDVFIPFIILLWVITLVLDFIFVGYYDRQSLRPKKLNLTQLNLLKITIEKINRQKYYQLNKSYILPIILLGYLTFIIVTEKFLFYPILFGGILFSLLYLLIFNGFLTIRLNSWKIMQTYQ